jgi:pimeloyl-ACP methyl ester carboxylesterase
MFGVVSRPVRPAPGAAALVIAGKTGPGDVWRWLAESLAQRGIVVLRFEPEGLGDSPGGDAAADMPVERYFRRVQEGAHASNIEDAVRWFRAAFAVGRTYVLGICGNCPAVVSASAALPEPPAGLILVTPPVLYMQEGRALRTSEARELSRGYVSRLRDLRSYRALLTGKSDYRAIRDVLVWLAGRPASLARRAGAKLDRSPGPVHANFNRYFWEGFKAVMARRTPVLTLLAALDGETVDFNAEFKTVVLDRRPEYAKLCTVVELPRTDHSLLFEEGRARALGAIDAWLGAVDVTFRAPLAS